MKTILKAGVGNYKIPIVAHRGTVTIYKKNKIFQAFKNNSKEVILETKKRLRNTSGQSLKIASIS